MSSSEARAGRSVRGHRARGSGAALVALLACLTALSISACGSSDSSPRTHADRTASGNASQRAARRAEKRSEQRQRSRERRAKARARARQRQRRRQARREAHQRQLAALGCPSSSNVLQGVYHPDRLVVRDPCRRVTGTVDDVRDEEDGDIHILVRLDSQHRSMLMSNNYSVQDGDLVVEFMPRDYAHLPRPSIGDRLTLVGAYVDDSEHGWAELHPVWAVSANGGPVNRSGPQFGGSPAYALSSNALATCHTNTGARCHGYTGEVAPPPDGEGSGSPGNGGSSPSSGGGGGGSCTPGYSPCIPPGSDVDCQGGTGDGPRYIAGPVQVTGSDPYGLDGDGNGVGC
jgi:hypothetical protein